MSIPVSTSLWQDYRKTLSNGSAYQSAIAMLELEPDNNVLRDLARQTRAGHYGEPTLDWEQWIRSVDEVGRGWSHMEWRLYDLAAALANNRPIKFWGTFDYLGSHLEPAVAILRRWATP